mgnify:CR=1 FL=1
MKLKILSACLAVALSWGNDVKAVPGFLAGTMVATLDDGWVPVDRLEIGDTLVSYDGDEITVKVTAIHEMNYSSCLLKICFDRREGRFIVVTPDQELLQLIWNEDPEWSAAATLVKRGFVGGIFGRELKIEDIEVYDIYNTYDEIVYFVEVTLPGSLMISDSSFSGRSPYNPGYHPEGHRSLLAYGSLPEGAECYVPPFIEELVYHANKQGEEYFNKGITNIKPIQNNNNAEVIVEEVVEKKKPSAEEIAATVKFIITEAQTSTHQADATVLLPRGGYGGAGAAGVAIGVAGLVIEGISKIFSSGRKNKGEIRRHEIEQRSKQLDVLYNSYHVFLHTNPHTTIDEYEAWFRSQCPPCCPSSDEFILNSEYWTKKQTEINRIEFEKSMKIQNELLAKKRLAEQEKLHMDNTYTQNVGMEEIPAPQSFTDPEIIYYGDGFDISKEERKKNLRPPEYWGDEQEERITVTSDNNAKSILKPGGGTILGKMTGVQGPVIGIIDNLVDMPSNDEIVDNVTTHILNNFI